MAKKDIDQILSENGLVRAAPRRDVDRPVAANAAADEGVEYLVDAVPDTSIPSKKIAASAPSIGEGKVKDRQHLVTDAAAAFASAAKTFRAANPTRTAGVDASLENAQAQDSVKMVAAEPKRSITGGTARTDSPAAEPKVVVIDTATGKIEGRQG